MVTHAQTLHRIEWNLLTYAPLDFVQYYLFMGCLFTDDIADNGDEISLAGRYKAKVRCLTCQYCKMPSKYFLLSHALVGHSV